MSRKIISLLLATVVTASCITVRTSAVENEVLGKKLIDTPRFFNVKEVPDTFSEGTTLEQAMTQTGVRDLVVHEEENSNARSYNSSESLRQGDVNNLVIYTKFKGEDEFLNKSYKGGTIKTVFDNMYNDSNISVNSYYDKLTQNKLDLKTSFLGSNGNGTQAIELDHERGYYMPCSDNNKIGYCEYTVVDKNTYEYIADMYVGDIPDTDPSDGVVTQHYLNTNSSAVYGENPYAAIYRESKLIYEVAQKANSTGIANVDIDRDGDSFIDAATVLLGVTPDNEITSQVDWSDLLWPHQTSMISGVSQEEIDEIKQIFNLDFTFLNEEGSQIKGSTMKKYNLFTSDFLLDDNKDIQSDAGKVGDVGTVCHELAHTFDLPDLYSYSNQDLACVGQWDLMEYTGQVPQFVNSYLRKEAGWLNDDQMPTVENDGEYELKPICNVGSEDVAGYIIKVPENPNQIFFVEYRKDEGDFDGATTKYSGNTLKNIYESGLVIYRVDTSIENKHNMLMPGNFDAPPYNIYTFRDADQQAPYDYAYSAINGVDEKTYGSIDGTVLKNALTFQDSTGEAVTNSRVVIDNVTVDGDKIKFVVDAKDPSAKTVEIKDNKVLVTFDEKIQTVDLNSISLVKNGSKEEVNVEVVEGNKVAISLKAGQLAGQYTVNISKNGIKDAVGKNMVNDFSKSIDAGEENVVVDVTDVVLNKTETTLKVGAEMQLNATINPENASNKNVTWASDKSDVVTVDSNGKIKALVAGQAIITVTTEDGNKTATCKVTVVEDEGGNDTVLVENVVLDKVNATLNIGENIQLNATINPEDASNKNLIWTSTNEAVAKVDPNGKVVAVGPGETNIIVTTEEGAKTATCTIKVNTPVVSVEGVTLDKTEVSLKVGQNVQLNATINPENATNKNVTWVSSNNEIATIDANGNIKALAAGTANITVTTVDGNKAATCKVIITAENSGGSTTIDVSGIQLDKTNITIKEGESIELNATVKPENASNKNVIWASANTDIATVDSNGKVTAVKAGNVAITVKTEAGNYMAICNVKVEKKCGTTTVTPQPTTPDKGTTTTKPGKGQLPQTGKETPVVAVGIIAILGGAFLALRRKRD